MKAMPQEFDLEEASETGRQTVESTGGQQRGLQTTWILNNATARVWQGIPRKIKDN